MTCFLSVFFCLFLKSRSKNSHLFAQGTAPPGDSRAESSRARLALKNMTGLPEMLKYLQCLKTKQNSALVQVCVRACVYVHERERVVITTLWPTG